MKKIISIFLALTILCFMGIVPAITAAETAPTSAAPKYKITSYEFPDLSTLNGIFVGYIGDADLDNYVTVMDATEIQLYDVGKADLKDSKLLSDADYDGYITVMDATEIQLYDVGKKLDSDTLINHVLYIEALLPESKARLKVWAPYQLVDIIQDQCDEFCDMYSDRNIRVEVVAQGEGDAAMMLLNDPDVAADVICMPCDQISTVNNAGLASKVRNELVQDVKDRNEQTSVNAFSINGQLLSYPMSADNGYCLVYDKRYISDTDAQTLEGVLRACRYYGKDFLVNSGNGYYACMFPFTGGLKTVGFEADGYTQKFNNYDATQVANSMLAFGKLFDKYYDVVVNREPTQIISGMSNGYVAAGIDGAWDFATLKAVMGKNLGIAKLPTINVNGVDKQIYSMHGYKGLCVNARTRYEKASHLLADYLTNEEAQLYRAVEHASTPTNINVQSSQTVKSSQEMTAMIEQSKYAVPQTCISYTFWDPMGYMGNELYNNGGYYTLSSMKTLLNRTVTNIRDY